MTFIEWLAGFRVIIDASILVSLIMYMIIHRFEVGTPHYCIAVGISLCVVGDGMSNIWVWHELLRHHELNTPEKIVAIYPIVGSYAWQWGALISAIGLVKLIREFAGFLDGAKFVKEWAWIIALATAATIPLISIWI